MSQEGLQEQKIILVPVTEVREIEDTIEIDGREFSKNVRTDMGDIPLLAKQIKENGVLMPCKGLKKDGIVYLTDGHRRFKACSLILEETGDVTFMPFILENGITEEKRIMEMILCNEGKPLNPVEQADAVFRLVDCGMDEEAIRNKTGFSNTYMSNLKMLYNAPTKIKNMVRDNVITGTLAMDVMRKEKNYDKAIETIEQTIAFKKANSSQTSEAPKITLRDIGKAKDKVNSFSAVKKAYRHYEKEGLVIRQDKIELFTFISSLIEGDYSYDELMAILYEPKIKIDGRRKVN